MQAPITNGDRKFAIESYKSRECPVCSNLKQPRFFVCRKCWSKLGPTLQSEVMVAYKNHGIASTEYLDAFNEVMGFFGD